MKVNDVLPKKKWTMDNNKTRAAGEGPWIATADVIPFKEFCAEQGYAWRDHPDPWKEAYQVRFDGQWMSILWNKNFKRYTVDRRLDAIVKAFKANRKNGQV